MATPIVRLKKAVLLTHRWLGVALSFLFVVLKIGAPPGIPGIELSVIKINTLATSECGGPRLHRIFHAFRTRSPWPQPSAKTFTKAWLARYCEHRPSVEYSR